MISYLGGLQAAPSVVARGLKIWRVATVALDRLLRKGFPIQLRFQLSFAIRTFLHSSMHIVVTCARVKLPGRDMSA